MYKPAAIGYITTLVVVIIMFLLCGTVFGTLTYDTHADNQMQEWQFTPTEKDGDYYFTVSLPSENASANSLVFETSHHACEVLIDDRVVYSVQAWHPAFNRSTGYRYNFVSFCDEDNGKDVTIHIISVYKNLAPKTTFYFGNERDIVEHIFFSGATRFFFAVLILITGVVLILYSFYLLSKKQDGETLLHFSLFAILLAFWSIIESPIGPLIAFWPVAFMTLDHYALMLMPMPFMFFIRRVFNCERNIAWKIYAYGNTAISFLRTILQLTTLYDLRETLWMTHISIGILIVMGIIIILREVRITKLTHEKKINLFCILILFASAVFELILYIFFQVTSAFGMVGFFVYVIAMGAEMIKASRRVMERAQEAEVYRKLAYTDELTGVYNRTAFHHDIKSQSTEGRESDGPTLASNTVFMFDMNDLKKCNDNFGHEYGDQYIKMIAEALQHVFGIDARCYRLGGDEFCAIMPNTNQVEIDNKLISLHRSVQEINKKSFVVPVSVAVGYAVFDADCDETLEDTLKRADALMYRNKQEFKAAARPK